eukprot:CAMPEP_0172499234 /NCGR_PEP_ID=MMETSP1066-20121228/124233_1 /TAXON_ID=671091 /ORGANISM="Coscinodiscus wailesii, Strain CCMP2513" /LENGTH=205 /DNA_ID=CAMNT_0013272853 /DNA_START=158 /DNA_END=775 /DNA_ORIENTATION=-
MNNGDISEAISANWKCLPPSRVAHYNRLAEEDKLRYNFEKKTNDAIDGEKMSAAVVTIEPREKGLDIATNLECKTSRNKSFGVQHNIQQSKQYTLHKQASSHRQVLEFTHNLESAVTVKKDVKRCTGDHDSKESLEEIVKGFVHDKRSNLSSLKEAKSSDRRESCQLPLKRKHQETKEHIGDGSSGHAISQVSGKEADTSLPPSI